MKTRSKSQIAIDKCRVRMASYSNAQRQRLFAIAEAIIKPRIAGSRKAQSKP